MSEENTVYIGKKETMNYVMAVVTQFNSGSKEVVIKARGRSMSKAIDVAEITKNRFVQNAEIVEMKSDTEQVERTGEEGTANVSSLEITLRLKA